jgi:type VI protein secretion system component VasK
MNAVSRFALFVSLWLLQASRALAQVADRPPQEKPSPLVWIILVLPAALVILMIYSIMRRERKRLTLVDTELQNVEKERQRNQAHREHVQARLDSLDQKLSQAVELLAAIERGQRKGDF